jgi:hypothetical protein
LKRKATTVDNKINYESQPVIEEAIPRRETRS